MKDIRDIIRETIKDLTPSEKKAFEELENTKGYLELTIWEKKVMEKIVLNHNYQFFP